jgi:hypothetical protein
LFAPVLVALLLILPLVFIEPVPLGTASANARSHKTMYRLRTPPGLPSLGLIHTYDGVRRHSVTLSLRPG